MVIEGSLRGILLVNCYQYLKVAHDWKVLREGVVERLQVGLYELLDTDSLSNLLRATDLRPAFTPADVFATAAAVVEVSGLYDS
ncbi:hypothetical protein ARTSIC4J27_3166 [Pseudarthrobacter siccitolerans]|uniref:Uncharacterized protein n=1 Tax=Pseudarthrobacter siccitolerans TaxID=861266 RepID=A0A024H625_9MICC|nr:hypothetical protein ARTSIC4J27_3166 [Pseudarthrobacter siccitolerans]